MTMAMANGMGMGMGMGDWIGRKTETRMKKRMASEMWGGVQVTTRIK